jgi:arylformamidase
MRFHDISVPLSSKTPTYTGDPGIEIRAWSSLQHGDAANVSLLHFGAHSGTHVDAPAHFIDQAGKVDAMPLESLIGEALVVEVPDGRPSVDESFIETNVPMDTARVLFKTNNSRLWSTESTFTSDYVYLEPEAARRLIAKGIRLVGIDYLSIEKFKTESHPTHIALLTEGIVILEGLNLSQIEPGKYELICLPLKIADGAGDGAPARAVLREL